MAKSKCKLPACLEGKGGGFTTLFFQRFELCCNLNKWTTDDDKIGQLYPLLSDRVFLFVTSLDATKRATYNNMKTYILAEYEDTELEETYAEQFTNRRLQSGEDLTTLMAELKQLVDKGYPTFSAADKARLVYNQFMRSLSIGARKHVLLGPKVEIGHFNMTTCDELLATAKLIDQVERPVGEASSRVKQPSVAVVENPIDDRLSRMMTAMELLTKKVDDAMSVATVAGIQQSRGSIQTTRGRSREGGFRGTCFKCGEPGHMARDCRGRSAACSECGNKGHKAEDCALRKRSSDDVCTMCGNSGHGAERCALRFRKHPLN